MGDGRELVKNTVWPIRSSRSYGMNCQTKIEMSQSREGRVAKQRALSSSAFLGHSTYEAFSFTGGLVSSPANWAKTNKNSCVSEEWSVHFILHLFWLFFLSLLESLQISWVAFWEQYEFVRDCSSKFGSECWLWGPQCNHRYLEHPVRAWIFHSRILVLHFPKEIISCS
jgi:hypothetical protein